MESDNLVLSAGTMTSYIHAWRESKSYSGTLIYASLYLRGGVTRKTLASLTEGGNSDNIWTSVRSEGAMTVVKYKLTRFFAELIRMQIAPVALTTLFQFWSEHAH